MLLAAIPGAVVGGRLFHVLDYADSYLAAPLTTLDLGHGSSSLVGAVIGGALSAAYICRLLGGSIGLWADAAAVPMLLAIGLGKLAIMLGGAGQGLASDGPMAVVVHRPRPVALDRCCRPRVAIAGAGRPVGAAGYPRGPGAGASCRPHGAVRAGASCSWSRSPGG